MRVRITEDRLKSTDQATGRYYDLTKDDEITVPDALGKRWCDRGWAVDVDGTYASTERRPGAQELEVPKTTVANKTRKKGGR